jgi:hypothetical protein
VDEIDGEGVNLGERQGAATRDRFAASQREAHTFSLVRAVVVLIHGGGPLYCRECT